MMPFGPPVSLDLFKAPSNAQINWPVVPYEKPTVILSAALRLDSVVFQMIPPPPISADMVDDEALGSMLISWYMSGYHTGFYLVCAPKIFDLVKYLQYMWILFFFSYTGFERRPQEGFQLDQTAPQMKANKCSCFLCRAFLFTRDISRTGCGFHAMKKVLKCVCCEEGRHYFVFAVNKI